MSLGEVLLCKTNLGVTGPPPRGGPSGAPAPQALRAQAIGPERAARAPMGSSAWGAGRTPLVGRGPGPSESRVPCVARPVRPRHGPGALPGPAVPTLPRHLHLRQEEPHPLRAAHRGPAQRSPESQGHSWHARAAEGQHLSDAFAQVNPLQKVPVLKDGDFILTESVAILLYLARKYKVPDHWYPQDLQACARVDEYLAWQHTALRRNCLRALWHKPVGAGCQVFKGRPKLAAWRQRVEAAVGEVLFQEAHEVILKAKDSQPADPTLKQKMLPKVLAMIQ
ncbi:glutathione S-transferase theta-1 isoform X2 [Bos indicus x Bos taurus]|uniref:glutathione S-transferase theta-1 isoform X2 n=1 Tax=Bos indicus x Bos taurus TaxID=30522 RepID=UPI000F7D4A83|nr:glutathione S-transferase theta-1 isoform X2 [Bos indicus x Bos taurus]